MKSFGLQAVRGGWALGSYKERTLAPVVAYTSIDFKPCIFFLHAKQSVDLKLARGLQYKIRRIRNTSMRLSLVIAPSGAHAQCHSKPRCLHLESRKSSHSSRTP